MKVNNQDGELRQLRELVAKALRAKNADAVAGRGGREARLEARR